MHWDWCKIKKTFYYFLFYFSSVFLLYTNWNLSIGFYLWALWTVVRFLANKCHKIGKRITIYTIWIFCIDMTGLCCSRTRMMTTCYMTWVLMMMRLSKNTKQMSWDDFFSIAFLFRFRSLFFCSCVFFFSVVVKNKQKCKLLHKPLQLYGFTWNLCSLLLHLCFAVILGCMIFRRFGWTVLIEHSCTWTKRLRTCLYKDCCVTKCVTE